MWRSISIFLLICVSFVVSEDYKKPSTFAVSLSKDNFAKETADFYYFVLYFSPEWVFISKNVRQSMAS